jgi:hypothetical protein
MTNTKKTSQSRRRLLDAARALVSKTEQLMVERGPLFRGAFQLRGTRCGKDGCKCNRGGLHTTAVLVVSEDGKRRSFYLRPAERPEVQRRVERYLHLRASRAKLSKLGSDLLVAADELIDALAEPHVPLRESDHQDGSRRPSRRRRER